VSDTLIRADDCQKILDNGCAIGLWKNDMESYTALAIERRHLDLIMQIGGDGRDDLRSTIDSTPSQALYRLAEKLTRRNLA
jgi:hypothetical protein